MFINQVWNLSKQYINRTFMLFFIIKYFICWILRNLKANYVTLLSIDQNRVLHFVKYYKSDSQLRWITLIYAIQIFWQIESKEKFMFNENGIANLAPILNKWSCNPEDFCNLNTETFPLKYIWNVGEILVSHAFLQMAYFLSF